LQYEPLSPELVLIDPELAKRERARLVELARMKEFLLQQEVRLEQARLEQNRLAHEFDVQALRQALERGTDVDEPPEEGWWREVGRFSRLRVLPAIAVCSLFANGYFLADLLSRTGDEASTAAIAVVQSSTNQSVAADQSAPTSVTRENLKPSTARHITARTSAATKKTHSVERKLVSRILAAPARRLPRPFIDAKTGLVRNNVQIVCRAARAGAFVCVVRRPAQGRQRAISVRYRVDRRGKWTRIHAGTR
jgi:hypothetical protein